MTEEQKKFLADAMLAAVHPDDRDSVMAEKFVDHNVNTLEKAIDKLLADAVKVEQDRCLDVALEQYAYWRKVEGETINHVAMGGMGASANILGRIVGMLPAMK